MSFLLLSIFTLLSIFFAFFLLYPFYLRDNQPARYKGLWRAIGTLFKNRYGAIWVLNLYLGVYISVTVGLFTQVYLLRLLATLIYFAIFAPTILWYPYYLKEKRPDKYKGVWKLIGEWLGDQRTAFPSKK